MPLYGDKEVVHVMSNRAFHSAFWILPELEERMLKSNRQPTAFCLSKVYYSMSLSAIVLTSCDIGRGSIVAKIYGIFDSRRLTEIWMMWIVELYVRIIEGYKIGFERTQEEVCLEECHGCVVVNVILPLSNSIWLAKVRTFINYKVVRRSPAVPDYGHVNFDTCIWYSSV